MANIVLDPTQPIITANEYPNALAYIQDDAPGYQIDFYPINRQTEYLDLDDCRLYGVDLMALQVCLKAENNSILAGVSPPKF